MTTVLESIERGPEGWPIIRCEHRNDDPLAFDDCWHEGEVWVLRAGGLYERHESFHTAYDRLTAKLVAAGVSGTVEVVGTGAGYRVLKTL